MPLVHLHVHSNFSLLQGAFSVEELVEAAAGLGMPAVALTDTNGLYGAVRFYEAARRAGIKPIVGAEIVRDGEQCICLAADREGYANLCRIVTERRLAGTPHYESFLGRRAEGGFDLAECVAANCEGLFVLSATPSVLSKLKGAVPEGRLYAEARADGLDSFETLCPALGGVSSARRGGHRRRGGVAQAAGQLDIPPAATVNVNFLRPGDRDTHAVLCAIRENRPLRQLRREDRMLAGERSFLQPPEQVIARLPGGREAVENTARIARACNLELELGVPHFPTYDALPPGETACSWLRQVARHGARRRYGRLTPKVRRRLDRELDLIGRLGLCHYFLVVWDIVEFARRRAIPHVGRGSAANSIVSYALGISAVDPLKFDLYFERFLNKYRTDMPDIDVDFCWRRRDEVLRYVYNRYPCGHVAMVSTHSTLRAKSAFRDVARVMGLPLGEIDRYSAMLPCHSVSSIPEAMERFPEMSRFPIDREPWSSVLGHAVRMDGYVRHLGIHLGGMVIGDRPLTHYTALQNSAKGIVITQCEMAAAERVGLVKIDLLGQRSLSIVSEAARAVRRQRGVRIDLDRLPDRDPRTARLLRRGRTMGCFQIESPGMRQLLQMLRAEGITDVIQGLSLIRPGPSGSGMKDSFIRRKRGVEPVRYLTPQIEQALSQTYGVMLYQEDILKVSQAVAGFSMAVGDELRKRITKSRSREAIAELRGRFMAGAGQRGIEPAVAEQIWSQVASFAAYSYCKAHATTYGHISHQAAYLKAHYPAEFLASVIANKAGFYEPRVYYQEARRFNVKVLAPSVNDSDVECQAEQGAIRPGLESVRALSARTIRRLLEERGRAPFESIEDFCARLAPAPEELDNLILCGAFDWTGHTRPTLLMKAELRGGARRDDPRKPRPPEGLWERHDRAEALPPRGTRPPLSPPVHIPPQPHFPLKERVRWELRILGMTHSGHPLDAWGGEIGERGEICSFQLPRLAGHHVSFLGWLVMMRHAVTHNREYMKFLCLEDRYGTVEVVVFPDVYRRWGEHMAQGGAYRVEGQVKEQHGAVSLVAERVQSVLLPPAVGAGAATHGAGAIPTACHTAQEGREGRKVFLAHMQ